VNYFAPPPAASELPQRFPSPFATEPHAIARRAAEELQRELRGRLGEQLALDAPGGGKMFGVLVVADRDGRIGYLRAFSGMVDGRWHVPGFVPPVFDAGARDAWFVDKDGKVTEAASANAWIVTPAGTLVTRHADHAILRGITRTVTLDVIKAQGLTVEERGFTLKEAYAAREAFETSASQIVMPVVSIDGHRIGDGKPGPIAVALRRAFHRFAEAG